MTFSKSEVFKCYQFAQDMIGNHNPNMIMERRDWEIFRDDFRGKLGEVALKKTIQSQFPNLNITTDIDYSVTPQGQWDITDLVICDRYINVKSIKGKSRFLLVEKKRYNDDGTYCYTNADNQPVQVDAYILVRVSIEPEITWLDMKYKNVEELKNPKPNCTRIITAEILGGITHTDFWERKHFAPKGIPCNLNSLSEIARGNTSVPMAQPGLPKTQILQQDNYLLSCDELMPLKNLFRSLGV